MKIEKTDRIRFKNIEKIKIQLMENKYLNDKLDFHLISKRLEGQIFRREGEINKNYEEYLDNLLFSLHKIQDQQETSLKIMDIIENADFLEISEFVEKKENDFFEGNMGESFKQKKQKNVKGFIDKLRKGLKEESTILIEEEI